jgi:cytidine deaminase
MSDHVPTASSSPSPSVASVVAAAVVSTAAAVLLGATLWHRRQNEEQQPSKNLMDAAPPDGEALLRLCVQRMRRVKPPRQSQFRVYAILAWEHAATGTSGWVSGTNSESAYIGGSLCAERAAAVQLRELPADTKVTGVYLISDLEHSCITPGVLCREYLLSCVDPDTPVHLGSKDLRITRVTSLRDLYPCRSVYEGVDRECIAERGKLIASRQLRDQTQKLFQDGPNGSAWEALVKMAMAAVNNDHFGAQMHPVQYAAAMQFADGTKAVAWQKAGLEYGTSVDSVTALLHQVDHKGAPVRIVQVDQFGVLHAPFAPARAQLYERGCGTAEVAVFDIDAQALTVTTINELVPDCPSMSELWPACC